VTEVSLPDGKSSGKPSYDFWAMRNNGDFFLLHSLFADERGVQKLFVDEFKRFDRKVYEEIVSNFRDGRVT
jgi:hypothetical protein